jgi:hypothetical protein
MTGPAARRPARAACGAAGVAAALGCLTLAGASAGLLSADPAPVSASAAATREFGLPPDNAPPLPAPPSDVAGTPAASRPAPAAAGEPSVQYVWRHGVAIVIAARAAPREAVARQLATLTGLAPLPASPQLAAARALTLHWQGTDAAQAWSLVLGSHTSHAVQCSELRCRLWLIDSPVSGPRPEAAAPPPASWPAEAPMQAEVDPPPAPTPDDGGVRWEPQQPDPPGLFPRD